MKASRFTEAQKAFVLKQGEEGTPVAEICRKAGISQATYFNWKKKYGGLRRPCRRLCCPPSSPRPALAAHSGGHCSGDQPVDLTLECLSRTQLPLDWERQEAMAGLRA